MAPHQLSIAAVGLSWRTAKWFLVACTVPFLIIWLMPISILVLEFKSYAPLHTLLEVFAVGVAAAIFAVGWHARVIKEAGSLSIIAVGFLAVSLLDTAHILSYVGMPDWITPSSGNKSIPFWFAARYAAAFSLLALVKPRRSGEFSPIFIAIAAMIACTYTGLAYWIVLAHNEWLPHFIEPGKGLTPIKIALEWGLVALTLVSIVVVWRHRTQPALYDPVSLMVALCLTILSELCFMLYSNLADMFNIVGHVYKVLAYGFLYHSLVAGSVKRPYRLLADNQGLLQQLTDNITQVFWMTSPDKKQMLFISPAFETIWGRSCKSLLRAPESWLDAIHPDDRSRVIENLKSQSEGSYAVEYRIVRPDGGERWIRDRAFPICDTSGKVQRIAGIAEDITEQRSVEQQLRQSKRDVESILDYMPALIGYWDLNLYNRFGNRAYYEWFGIDPAAMSGMHIRDVIGEDLYRQNLPYIEAALRGELQVFDRAIPLPDGRLQYSLAHYIPDIVAGKTQGFYVLISDISSLKLAEDEKDRLQAQLLQAKKMESIGHLTGGIAHDFNNMLGAMLGYAALAQVMLARPGGTEKIGRYMEQIVAAGSRAKELIQQMLVFSRLGPEQPLAEVPVILLQPVVKEVTHLLRSSIPSTVEINYQIEDADLHARIEPVQLHQIILNLVINARDAIGEYGRIDVTLARRAVSVECAACHEFCSGDYVELTVSDSGQGIPDHVLAKIFDPFFTTKDVGKGTGMGLSVVHGIVHSVGGHIVVECVEGKGTSMRILLPTVATEETCAKSVVATPLPESADNMLAGLRIMVVDDEHAMSSMLTELLTMQGAQVAAYNFPLEALAAFTANPDSVDVVITDETMPKLSGLDMARAMLKLRPNKPIILCTGHSTHVTEDSARLAGIAGFMHKPLEMPDLLQLIQERTGRARPE